ncbi:MULTISPECIES: nitrate/nitrite transporter NrtS [Ramlibacter]|uniref:Nitrate/nitrite transporter NrtS n=1 Tax=Ramlibacter aquaticus TaxID=2780094 RepID=A0ABR9SK76_9BURK|nr:MULTISPECIES: nitrate/nitrite transporter NrtS [Ramlibacter]MBE7942745.1 nitrate/nitrite transporter NrtS [Ramlibacter aquaticus]
MNDLMRAALSKRIAASALRISLAVGTVLNLANQSEALFGTTEFSWLHGFLNYLVPYCVASYSAAKNEVTSRADARP